MSARGSRTSITPLDGARKLSSEVSRISSRRKSITDLVTTTFARGPHSYGYSKEKFLALQQYTATTSAWRVAAVILVTPIPGLVGALLPSFVPLQNPLARIGDNPGYLANVFIICFVVQLGMLIHWRTVSEVPIIEYTWFQICTASVIAATTQWLFIAAVCYLWTFPIPMSWLVGSCSMAPAVILGHLLVLRERCWQDKKFITGIKLYAPALMFQCIQIVLYPAFSVLFDNVTTVYQVLLTLAFPLVKYLMKKGLRRYTRELKDFNNEVAVTGIEICASLYQSMILQSEPSHIAFIIIMAADLVQGLVAVKFFMDRQSDVPQNQILRHTLQLLGDGIAIDTRNTQQQSQGTAMPRVLPAQAQHAERGPAKSIATRAAESKPSEENSQQSAIDDAPALQLLAVAESILLVEYLEVAIPVVNTIFVAISCQFSSAQYNPRLRKLYLHPETLRVGLRSTLLYSLLQAASFVAMHLVMRYRYGLSAVYHLAFILEHHWLSIVGKMIAWLPIILHFTVVHYGVDFSFRFDFTAMLADTGEV